MTISHSHGEDFPGYLGLLEMHEPNKTITGITIQCVETLANSPRGFSNWQTEA